ncbi:MAG: hypothetical protein ABSF64_06400 [Bryobacteraceae bacterium]|jgi:hypothetical protein
MPTINQIRANRRNAKKSTGPKTQAGKDRVRFNALVHGLRAESAVLPGEDQAKFDQHLARLSAAWINQDDMERDLVETIAVNQGKLARIDRSESRLERSISCTIADLERYRKGRIERHADAEPKDGEKYQGGLLWQTDAGRSYSVLPKVLVLDGVWREIPREILGDFTPQPPS